MHSRLDNSFILSSVGVPGFQLYNLRYVWYPHTINLFAENSFVLVFELCCALLCIFVSDRSWIPFASLPVLWSFQEKIERDYFFYFPTGEWGYCELALRSEAPLQNHQLEKKWERIQEHGVSIVLANLDCKETQTLTLRMHNFYPLYF